MAKMGFTEGAGWILSILGGLQLGLMGAFGFDLVGSVLGGGIVTRILYVLIGLSAVAGIWQFALHVKKP
jgi:uncharacterized membrane protein YuzA (DUF378 family)